MFQLESSVIGNSTIFIRIFFARLFFPLKRIYLTLLLRDSSLRDTLESSAK